MIRSQNINSIEVKPSNFTTNKKRNALIHKKITTCKCTEISSQGIKTRVEWLANFQTPPVVDLHKDDEATHWRRLNKIREIYRIKPPINMFTTCLSPKIKICH